MTDEARLWTRFDVATFLTVALMVAEISMVASQVLSRHATRVDPVVALRSEFKIVIDCQFFGGTCINALAPPIPVL
ncbi:MAG: hypothetical protein ABJA98_05160 [Acidobacteriota bacterium]